MATKAQIRANRINAQRSTGPRTDAGKIIARENSLRHGLCAGIPCMTDETSEEVEELLANLREEHQPVGSTEEILVYKIAEHFFFAKRASYLLTEQLDWADKGENNSREIGLMLRYHTTADRGYYRALTELRKVQKERRLQEIGSVSQEAQPAAAQPPIEAETPAAEPQKTTPATAKTAPPPMTSPAVPQPAVKTAENVPAGQSDTLKKAA